VPAGEPRNDMAKLPLAPRVFVKVLVVILVALGIAYVTVIWIAGSISTTDVVGSAISAILFAYLVHLWLVPGGPPGDQGP